MSCNTHDVVDKLSTTFLIAVGKKGQSHQAMELQFAKELQRLQSGNCSMYSKAHGCVVPIYLELLVSLQDQPERRGMNQLMLGSGKYSAWWGYSCNISETCYNIPTCMTCTTVVICDEHKYSSTLNNCPTCTNWETGSDNPLLWSTPPKNYPSDALTSSNYILPFKLNYGMLRDAVTQAHKNIVASTWSNDEAKQYLWVHCLSNDAVSNIIEHATNEKCLTMQS
jgi:hypothetical protein